MKRFWKDGDLREHPCGLYVLHADVQDEIESLHKQLAKCVLERDHYKDKSTILAEELERIAFGGQHETN